MRPSQFADAFRIPRSIAHHTLVELHGAGFLPADHKGSYHKDRVPMPQQSRLRENVPRRLERLASISPL
jgi:hypothetical protein